MYSEQKFDIPDLSGISEKQVTLHLGLYAGYVKFLNTLLAVEAELKRDPEKNAYALAEVHRRIGFEWNGMRMHEYYFESLERGAEPLRDGALKTALEAQYGSFEAWQNEFRAVGLMRGIGWTILSYDGKGKRFVNAWVTDHELGQLAGAAIILPMDMWEHAYMVDYPPAEKKKYVEAFLKNVNWSVAQARFAKAR